jgi:hypothetical protein
MALALIATPALAADPANPATPTKDKKVCKRSEEGSTGSHLRRSPMVCRTATEWRELEDYTERTLREAGETSGINERTSPASGPTPNPPN